MGCQHTLSAITSVPLMTATAITGVPHVGQNYQEYISNTLSTSAASPYFMSECFVS